MGDQLCGVFVESVPLKLTDMEVMEVVLPMLDQLFGVLAERSVKPKLTLMDMVVMVTEATELELLVTQLEPHSLPEAHKDSVERDPPKLLLPDTVMDVV